MSELLAGTYKVNKILSCAVGESPEKKTAFFQIEFLLENGNEITWNAWLSNKDDKAKEAAAKNLQKLHDIGFRGDRLDQMADPEFGLDDLFVPVGEEISIVVEIEDYAKKDGSIGQRPSIKWVNVGQKGGLTKMDKEQAIVKFKSLPFDDIFKKIKLSSPLKQDEIPF